MGGPLTWISHQAPGPISMRHLTRAVPPAAPPCPSGASLF